MKQTRLVFLLTASIFLFTFCKKSNLADADPGTTPPPSPNIGKTPRLLTDSATGLSLYSVTLGGKIIDTGGAKVTEQGLLVGISGGATIDNHFKKFKLTASDSGTFRTIVVSLPSEVTFYVRAYGINKEGVGYGNEIIFTTKKEKVYNGWSPTLTSQREVNEFGANQYTTITNGLEITGSDITDLSPLQSITILGGGLNIKRTSLRSLKGLDNLEVIGNMFYNTTDISYNPMLQNFSGLENLKILRGTFQIAYNDSLLNVTGLKQLNQIEGGSFGVYDCQRMQSLSGLETLQVLDGDINLHRNPSLTDISNFGKLSFITGDIRITYCNSLASLTGFEALTTLRYLQLSHNARLINVSGFKNLTSLQGFTADSMRLLKDFSGFNKLTSINGVTIQRCPALTTMQDFQNLTSTLGLTLASNSNLISLQGLEKIKITERIEITGNDALPNLKGLDSLHTITGNSYSLTISNNRSLTSLIGLEAMRSVSGQLFFENNAPDINHCALKPFLLQYNGTKLVFLKSGVMQTKQQLLAACP